MQKERYKKHPDFPKYRFYDDGRIQSMQKLKWHGLAQEWLPNPHYLTFVVPRLHKDNNMWFANVQNKDGNQTTVCLHKIVAQLFVRNPKKKTNVWFKNDNKNKYFYSNLFWVTQGELNHIQVRLGTRDMIKQAKIMRERRPENFGGGRKKGSKVINGKVILPKKKK